MSEQLWNYLRYGKRDIYGWLQRVDAEMIGAILEWQGQAGVTGGCVEIGVHHGKSFIPLCLALRENEVALCIDIFDDQAKNLDSSGKGDIVSFKDNLEKHSIDQSRFRIYKGSSEDVEAAFILSQVGRVRFFSVDGGHWRSIVKSDLLLAEEVLADSGVIALDDYCRAEWPDVTYGYTLWQNETTSDIVPFAVGSNKLYLCRKDYSRRYRSALKTPFLMHYFSKTYATESSEMDCYRVEPFNQDEESLSGAVRLAMKIFRPAVYRALKEALKIFQRQSKPHGWWGR